MPKQHWVAVRSLKHCLLMTHARIVGRRAHHGRQHESGINNSLFVRSATLRALVEILITLIGLFC